MQYVFALGLMSLLGMGPAFGAEEKTILEVVPSLQELGAGWTTNLITYLIDPRGRPPEIDYRGHPETSEELNEQRLAMQTNGRTACAMILYGRSNLVMNSGLYRVCIQRWGDRRSLHNAWTGWKMNPNRVLRSHRAVGEDLFWVNQAWRDALIAHDLVFRRGLFHVTIQAGIKSDPGQMVRLAEAVDAKIRGRMVPKAEEQAAPVQ